MASGFYFRNAKIFVSNSRFDSLVNFAIVVAESMVRNNEERTTLKKLIDFRETMYIGSDMGFTIDFKISEYQFLSNIFKETSRRVFLRELGNTDSLDWQPSFICDAESISRLLGKEYRNEQ